MFILRRKAEIVGTVMYERKNRDVRKHTHARAVECFRVKRPFVGKREETERGSDDANGLVVQKLRRRAPSGRVFIGNIDLVILVRFGLPGDAGKASQPSVRRANDPYGRPALTASARAVGGNGGLQLLDQFAPVDLGVGVQVQLDVFTQRNRCETGLHGC